MDEQNVALRQLWSASVFYLPDGILLLWPQTATLLAHTALLGEPGPHTKGELIINAPASCSSNRAPRRLRQYTAFLGAPWEPSLGGPAHWCPRQGTFSPHQNQGFLERPPK